MAVLALAFAAGASAQEYSFRFYGAAEGLGNLVVLSLAQDRAGYIWAGTETGLYRYDGSRFRLVGQAEGLPCSTEVHSLFVASDGALWANTCAKIFRFDGQRFQAIPGIGTLLRGAQAMADASRGGVLIATPSGLYEASESANGAFSTRPYPLPEPLEGKPLHGILRQGSQLWFGCDRALCLEEAGRVSVFGPEQGLPEDSWDAIRISPDGTVWVRSPKSVYSRPAGQSRFSREKPDIASSGFWGAMALSRDGSVMIPTDQGLAIYSKSGWSVVNRQRGLRNELTGAVLEDREGSVWIGLTGGGVARWLGRGVWESWKAADGLPSDIVWSIRRDRKGNLWVGTSLGLTRLDNAGRTKTWTRKDGLGGDNVRWLAEASDGAIWAAMKPGGMARIDPATGKVLRADAQDGLPCDPEDVFADQEGRLWAPTGCGLFVNDHPAASNRFLRVETPDSFDRDVWKLIEDSRGTIWIATRGGLWSLREGKWRQHGRADGLLTDNPYVMALAPDGSIWLRHRYDAGIDRLEVSGDRIVRATAVLPADPQAAQGTAFHGFDAFGNFWRGSPNGVSVRHWTVWTTFTTEDGLVWNDCDGEAFWADSDGGVWLGTSGGLAHYRAADGVPPRPPVAYPIISRIEVDKSARTIRAEFSSLNYKAEQLVQFAYRLDGAPWTGSPERSVSVSGLGPGKHRLEVRSRVRDGPFFQKIASAEFRLEPKWTETWWARLLALAFLAAAILQFIRWRLSAAAKREAELETIVAARTAKLSLANYELDEKARQLHDSENRLKNAERLAHVGHWDWGLDGNRFSWSEEMFRIFGQPKEFTPSYEKSLDAIIPQDRERVAQWVRDCLDRKNGHSIEFQIARPDSDLRTVSCISEVALDDKGRPLRLFGACQDITEIRRAQQETFERQKLESVGTLASGIAHDFNNLLGGVVAQAELAMGEIASGCRPEEELKAIRDVAMRGAEIVRQLMIYSGRESPDVGPVDLSAIVKEMLALLKVSVSKHAVLETDLGVDLPAVRANAAQLRQIVMNLVTNASEAVGDRDGTIHVTTRCVKAGRDSPGAILDRFEEGDYLQLEVSDSGCGMPPETQAKVFDPFFTTKIGGHGLGLPIVHGVVRGLGGAIRLTSEPGRGTTFQILLPCADAAAGEPCAPESPETPGSFRGATALVVDDENPLRQAVATMLRQTGFEVFEAADGSSAIDLLRANGHKIDVMLLDMSIPGPSSREVVAEAAIARQDVKVILTSAYSQEMIADALSAPQIRGFIRKPFQFRDLARMLDSGYLSVGQV
jgi:PAS domain S-box-containing protein